jgi:hypothetical protein
MTTPTLPPIDMNVSPVTDAELRRALSSASIPTLWREIAMPRPAERDTWYDPAALHEEAERWDGMA